MSAEEPQQVFSLGFDEVNDNVDEFLELRGEGRYFGVNEDDPNPNITGPKCKNCHKRGHIKAECKTVVCLLCGAHDDHYSKNCPKSITCTNCGQAGHFRNACTERVKRIYCQECSSNRHTSDQCPTIWRSYVTLASYNGGKKGLPTNIYCYNCADKGHYGDECNEMRSSRTPNPDGSAFAGDNLPKQLREKYKAMISSMRRRTEEREEYIPPQVQERRRQIEENKRRREQEYHESRSLPAPTNRFGGDRGGRPDNKRKRDDGPDRSYKIRKTFDNPNFSHNNGGQGSGNRGSGPQGGYRGGPQGGYRGGQDSRGPPSRGPPSRGPPSRGPDSRSSYSGRNGYSGGSSRGQGGRGPPSRGGPPSSGSNNYSFPRGGGPGRPNGPSGGRGGGRGGRR